MYGLDNYAAVRRFVFVEGHSEREAARVFGLARKTVAKMCRFAAPPGYQRTKPIERPTLGPFLGVIDAILDADKLAPPKQRHTAKRIFERLKAEHGYGGGLTVVKDYVREQKVSARETFVPLAHPPGHAQVDFGEAVGVIGGVRQKMHVFYMDLPHSDAPFMKAYPAETTEAFLDGHVAAFAFFASLSETGQAGVPQSILYDNTKLAVAKICGDGTRDRTRAFTGLLSHYLFADRFGRRGKGNDVVSKTRLRHDGKVEALVKHGRRQFLTPVPVAESYAALNARLEADCLAHQTNCAGRHTQTIAERLRADLAQFRALPAAPFEPCEVRTARVSSTALVRYRGNDYSVPTTYGFREVVVKGFVDEVLILSGADAIARHRRSYDKGALVFDPLHYLALIEQKPGALDQAAPLQHWELPDQFAHLRRLMEARMGRKGKREYIQVLRLMELFAQPIVAAAISDAIKLGAIGFDAVKQLTLARVERRAPQLDMAAYPYLPRPTVTTTRACDYTALLGAGCRWATEGASPNEAAA